MRALLLVAAMLPIAAAVSEYTGYGSPTNDEQAFLELINRARADPAGEGLRLRDTADAGVVSAYDYFNVDLTMMANAFAAIPAAPPLAFNARLIASARGHTQWMKDNDTQDHYEGAITPGDRVRVQGYDYSVVRENIYAYADGVFYGHAGFEVDWGTGTGGMQNPPGHRNNIHAADVREIGIGVLVQPTPLTTVGPMIVTQDFASRSGLTPFITGVVYTDDDHDGAYTAGEGKGGIRVDVAGSGWYAVTATSGGYAVPVPGDGTYQVTLTHLGTNAQLTTAQVTVSGGANRKFDYRWPVNLGSDTTPPARPASPVVSLAADGRPTLSGTTESAATITVYDGLAMLGTAVADGSGHWSWTSATALGEGVHLLTVVATDWSGNASQASPAATLVMGPGGSAPAATSPAGGGGGGCGAGAGLGLLLLGLALRRRR